MASDSSADNAPSLVDIRGILSSIWRRKWLVALAVFLAQFVYLAFHLSSPRLYTTTTQFIFKDSQGSAGGLGGLADLVGIRAGGARTNLSDFFSVILFTDEFLKQVIERKWVLAGGDSAYLHEYWKLKPYTESDGPNAQLRNERKRIGTLRGEITRFGTAKYIDFDKDKRTNLVSMTTRFTDPRLSYDINVGLVDLLNDHLLNKTKTQQGENRRFIEKRLAEVSADLRASEDALLAYQMRNLSVTSPPVIMEQGRLRRSVEINQQIFLELKKQLEMARIEELKESPLIQIISSAQYPLLPDRRLDIKRWGVITWIGFVLGCGLAWWAGSRPSLRSRSAKSGDSAPQPK